MKTFKQEELFKLDGDIPLLRAVPYGVQHILAMFVANLAPILIIAGVAGLGDAQTGALVQSAMLIAGIGTLIQLFPLWRVGSGLPIVMGISFTFVTVLTGVVATYGYNAAIGAIIVGGIFEGVLGLFAKYWRRIISPIVAAVVVTSIGFSLLSVGATSFGGGSGAADFGSPHNLVLGCVSLAACLVFQVLAKGKTKQLSVLFGLIVGYVLAVFMGKVDFSGFADVGLFALPQPMPFAPEFNLGAIVSVALIFLVSATETIGDTTALTMVGLNREVRERELSGSIACDGFVSTLSACFGCLPITSFSQNIGLVVMTKVVNRKAIATGAVIMILAAFLPVISVVFSSLPEAVLGGCTIMMFGNIIVSGFQMIARAGFSQRNITIAALSLAVGIGFTQVGDLFAIFPELVQSVFAQNCVAVVFLVAIVANLVLPKDARAGEGADAAADGASAAADGALAADGAGAGALGAGAAAAAGSATVSEAGATSDAARANGLSDTAGLTGEFDEEQPAKA
ncbi:uracil-xanthine permease family protein [Rubneribacter badeniensis]|uniref:uracil-xanthine permease family protein n=1 Tax=Rubneribacter badeniensis TaxID=2070688 RepID=UPI001EFE6B09|nr:nucleobase:cation symporter-2 family protein [Rubneribacter badeniensis]